MQRPGDLLRIKVYRAGFGVEIVLECYCEVSLLRPRAVIGEIEAVLDDGIDVGGSVLTGNLSRMQEHVLDDGIGALAVLHDLGELSFSMLVRSLTSSRIVSASPTCLKMSLSSSVSSTESAEKLLTKLSGFLISCAIPAVSAPSEAIFS